MSLLLNKFVLGFLLAIAIMSGIGILYWNMNRWKDKAEELEVQLESMEAARDLLLDLNKAEKAVEKKQVERRASVRKSIDAGSRTYFE